MTIKLLSSILCLTHGDDPVHTYSVGVGEGGDHSGPDLRALTPASLEGRFEPPTLAHHGKQAYRWAKAIPRVLEQFWKKKCNSS